MRQGMQAGTERRPSHEAKVVPVNLNGRRRVRNEVWYLKRRAEGRRNRANALVLGSVIALVVLCRLFYVLLTK
jgi:hypothetical protein